MLPSLESGNLALERADCCLEVRHTALRSGTRCPHLLACRRGSARLSGVQVALLPRHGGIRGQRVRLRRQRVSLRLKHRELRGRLVSLALGRTRCRDLRSRRLRRRGNLFLKPHHVAPLPLGLGLGCEARILSRLGAALGCISAALGCLGTAFRRLSAARQLSSSVPQLDCVSRKTSSIRLQTLDPRCRRRFPRSLLGCASSAQRLRSSRGPLLAFGVCRTCRLHLSGCGLDARLERDHLVVPSRG
mmetsp:Transcript_38581/g.114647  ORF Transcript_38581/g.114647 Transcript_38581/m.114647 type:complete len:246 (-) Transcript_38581:2444-3181(-)